MCKKQPGRTLRNLGPQHFVDWELMELLAFYPVTSTISLPIWFSSLGSEAMGVLVWWTDSTYLCLHNDFKKAHLLERGCYSWDHVTLQYLLVWDTRNTWTLSSIIDSQAHGLSECDMNIFWEEHFGSSCVTGENDKNKILEEDLIVGF